MKKTEQKVIKFIDDNKLISTGDSVLISLSGGPDSVFLLHFLNKFKKRFGITLGTFHLNHKLRGKDADADELFCRETCKLLNIPFFVTSADVKKYASINKLSVEEAGRTIRYNALTFTAEQNNFNKIATAHNANDNAETVLLNLVKGAGLRGIAGIPVKRNNIIRPILALTKEEILNHLNENKIKFRVDKSNLSNDYQRNYLRNKVIPLVKKLNPSLENTLLSSSRVFRERLLASEEKILTEADAFSAFLNQTLEIDVDKLKKKDNSEASEIVKVLIERNFYNPVTFKDVIKVLSLACKQAGTIENLSGSLTAVRERKSLLISKNPVPEHFSPLVIKAGEKKELKEGTLEINKNIAMPDTFPNDKCIEYISADDLDEEFIVRRWENGDRFIPLGLKGSKKISDFLNEQKVLSSGKKNQLVLTNKGRIIWILGLRIDDRVKIKKSTKKVYQLCLK